MMGNKDFSPQVAFCPGVYHSSKSKVGGGGDFEQSLGGSAIGLRYHLMTCLAFGLVKATSQYIPKGTTQ